MSDLDFSDLTDDQIVELATALAQEALRRNPAVGAAFQAALVTEKERAEAAARGGAQAKEAELRRIQDLQRRAEQELANELAKATKRQALATILQKAAQIADRDLTDVTLVLTDLPSGKPTLYLNAGDDVTGYGGLHLVHYQVRTGALKTSWALDAKKTALLAWAKEAIATLRVLKIDEITVKGMEL